MKKNKKKRKNKKATLSPHQVLEGSNASTKLPRCRHCRQRSISCPDRVLFGTRTTHETYKHTGYIIALYYRDQPQQQKIWKYKFQNKSNITVRNTKIYNKKKSTKSRAATLLTDTIIAVNIFLGAISFKENRPTCEKLSRFHLDDESYYCTI